jgi:DNA polymerase
VAGQALFGSSFSVTRSRGETLPWPPASGPFADSRLAIEHAFATIHPSAILRGPDDERTTRRQGMVADLVAVRELSGKGAGSVV